MPWPYDSDRVADAEIEERVTEVIREKIFQRMNQEIPYTTTQSHIGWRRGPDGSYFLETMLQVENVRHRGMIIGKNGEVLSHIRKNAITDLEKMLKAKVHLDLRVVVRKKWEQGYMVDHDET